METFFYGILHDITSTEEMNCVLDHENHVALRCPCMSLHVIYLDLEIDRCIVQYADTKANKYRGGNEVVI